MLQVSNTRKTNTGIIKPLEFVRFSQPSIIYFWAQVIKRVSGHHRCGTPNIGSLENQGQFSIAVFLAASFSFPFSMLGCWLRVILQTWRPMVQSQALCETRANATQPRAWNLQMLGIVLSNDRDYNIVPPMYRKLGLFYVQGESPTDKKETTF